MKNKKIEAVLIGFLLWAFGIIGIILFNDLPLFNLIIIPLIFLTIPVIYFLTLFHVRNVKKSKKEVTVQFGLLITLTQFPLDIAIWSSNLILGFPAFSFKTNQLLIIALLINYFILLSIPWWIASKTQKD